jgi:hypothetical protein
MVKGISDGMGVGVMVGVGGRLVGVDVGGMICVGSGFIGVSESKTTGAGTSVALLTRVGAGGKTVELVCPGKLQAITNSNKTPKHTILFFMVFYPSKLLSGVLKLNDRFHPVELLA